MKRKIFPLTAVTTIIVAINSHKITVSTVRLCVCVGGGGGGGGGSIENEHTCI